MSRGGCSRPELELPIPRDRQLQFQHRGIGSFDSGHCYGVIDEWVIGDDVKPQQQKKTQYNKKFPFRSESMRSQPHLVFFCGMR
eukprot:gene25990-biopygen12652